MKELVFWLLRGSLLIYLKNIKSFGAFVIMDFTLRIEKGKNILASKFWIYC